MGMVFRDVFFHQLYFKVKNIYFVGTYLNIIYVLQATHTKCTHKGSEECKQ
jgi:hypothetical protein